MNSPKDVRDDIRNRLGDIVSVVNAALRERKTLAELKPTLERLGRGGKLPHWYRTLERSGALPNLDGKSLGSVLEMVFVAVLERKFYRGTSLVPFSINPARGVDVPGLELGVKSPSENYCTSEPFFSAYERLIGNTHDAVVLLTDYQTRKKSPPLRIQIIKHAYLSGSQIADKNLCVIAKEYRNRLLRDNISELKKIVRFLAYVNQSDWEAKAIVGLLSGQASDLAIEAEVAQLAAGFVKTNVQRESESRQPIPDACLERIKAVLNVSPRWVSVVNAADNWVIETQKDFARYPNDNEWERFLNGPLDGVIGMSYALQWRYNFGPLFRQNSGKETKASLQ